MSTKPLAADKVVENGWVHTEAQGKANILVIDDEEGFREMLSRELRDAGYIVATAVDGSEALKIATPGRFQLAISDLSMPKVGGLELIKTLRVTDPDLEFIMMTGYATVESAVEAMKAGAYDYVQKPFNLDELLLLVEKSLEKSQMRSMVAVYEASRHVFESVRLEALLPYIAKSALKILNADDISIMILDECGRLHVKAAAGMDNPDRMTASIALGEAISGKAAQWKLPIILNADVLASPKWKGHSSLHEIKSAIVHPLLIGDELLGVINVNRITNDQPFTDVDVRSATIFSSQASQALFNAKLYDRLEKSLRDHKETQIQLQHSEKIAGLGRMAAGVAHELNNPLMGVSGFSELLLNDPDLSEQQRKDIQTIHEQSMRCRTIVRNLLQFSRRKEVEMAPLNLRSLIEATLSLVNYDVSSKLKIVQEISDAIPNVTGDENQLQQVFVNLITNARQAMEHIPDPTLIIRAVVEQNQVVIRFIDNGPGIDEKVLSKIFDPFFTTKAVGKGTGLGLSISFEIIEQHQGQLSVESKIGRGTTFIVRLPLAELN